MMYRCVIRSGSVSDFLTVGLHDLTDVQMLRRP